MKFILRKALKNAIKECYNDVKYYKYNYKEKYITV